MMDNEPSEPRKQENKKPSATRAKRLAEIKKLEKRFERTSLRLWKLYFENLKRM